MMEKRCHVSRVMGLFLALLVFVAACQPVQAVAPVTPNSPATDTPTNLPATPTSDTGGLPSDAAATLLSLEQVDDYPLYVMHYRGSYDYPRITAAIAARTGFGCSLFAALGDTGDMLYGRNFDWEFSPALLLYTDPPDGYASVSMVDLLFLDMEWKSSPSLTEVPIAERLGLLSAPSMPFDGMNEYGLVVGMAAVSYDTNDYTSYDASRPTIGSIGIIRQMLDHARSVEEAVQIFTQYNIDFAGGPAMHYLLADPSGKAVLLEFYQKELVQLTNREAWHMATNHLRCIAEGDGGCWRYNILTERLTASHGQLDQTMAMQLLSEVKQDNTQWSVVYDMSTGDVKVVIGQDYATVHTFHLDMIKPEIEDTNY